MKFSKAHQKLADYLNNPRVLDHPEEFLGPNWKNVLNFWFYLDTLSDEQKEIVKKRYFELNDADWRAAWAARDAAYDAAWAAWAVATHDAACAVRAAVANFVAAWATRELMGSDKILSQNKSLTFFPMFLNL